MLRYFYILVCIQLCFCTEYIDNAHSRNFERSVRSKTNKVHKKQTRSPKKTRLVQFDLQNFMRKNNEGTGDDGREAYMKRRESRRASVNYGDYGYFIEPNENVRHKHKGGNDYSNVKDNSGLHSRSSQDKEAYAKQFNIHTLSFDEKKDAKFMNSREKSTINSPNKLVPQKDFLSGPEKRCSFRNMKMPFFSSNKLTPKAKRQKKRRMFCFNCHKKPTTNNQLPDPWGVRTDDYNKDHTFSKANTVNKVSKRAYEELCPKCIKELLYNLRKKTTKKGHNMSSSYSTTRTLKARTTPAQKLDHMDDNLRDSFYYLSNVRRRREVEERERERQLKELDEVEKKIENVHITAPTFSAVSLSVDN